MKIIRTINRDKVYRHCNEHGYYTCGNNREYSAMLDKCADYEPIEASDEDILAIAKDIWEHSDMSDFLASGGDYECFVWGIFNECTRYEIISD